jgi:hypothetical protein
LRYLSSLYGRGETHGDQAEKVVRQKEVGTLSKETRRGAESWHKARKSDARISRKVQVQEVGIQTACSQEETVISEARRWADGCAS